MTSGALHITLSLEVRRSLFYARGHGMYNRTASGLILGSKSSVQSFAASGGNRCLRSRSRLLTEIYLAHQVAKTAALSVPSDWPAHGWRYPPNVATFSGYISRRSAWGRPSSRRPLGSVRYGSQLHSTSPVLTSDDDPGSLKITLITGLGFISTAPIRGDSSRASFRLNAPMLRSISGFAL
jgi:hypothetical protein